MRRHKTTRNGKRAAVQAARLRDELDAREQLASTLRKRALSRALKASATAGLVLACLAGTAAARQPYGPGNRDRCQIVGVYWDNVALECVAGDEDSAYAAHRRRDGHGALNVERMRR